MLPRQLSGRVGHPHVDPGPWGRLWRWCGYSCSQVCQCNWACPHRWDTGQVEL